MLLQRSRLVSALALALLASGPASAPAAGACPQTRIDLPPRLSVDRPYTRVDVPLVRSCAAEYVASDLYGPRGLEDVFIYDPARNGAVDHIDLYDWRLRPGTYSLRDGVAYGSSSSRRGTVAPDVTVLRYGASLGIGTSRAGSTVTVRVSARRYSPDLDRMVPYSGRVVGLRQRSGPSAAWTTRAFLRTNARGDAAVSFSASSPRQYQAWFGTTPSFWAARTAVSVR